MSVFLSIATGLSVVLMLAGSRSALAECIAPPALPTGWWAADGNGIDTVAGRNAVLENGATYAEGLVGPGAFAYDGVNDAASVTHETALNVGTGDFTVNFWVHPEPTSGERVMVEKWDPSTNTGWTLSNRGGLYFAGTGSAIQTAASIPAGNWTHVALRRSGGTVTLFKNGTQVGSTTGASNFNTTVPLLFGRRRGVQGFFWNGRIDEIQYHVGTALSNDAIQAIHAAGSFGQCTNPAVCGDGIIAGGEQCDDGNLVDGDGCDADCGYTPVVAVLPPGGGTVSTDVNGTGATSEIPTQITLETTAGGLVTIDSVAGSVALDGVQLIGVSLQLAAPPTTPSEPMVLTIVIDASVIPAGIDPLSQLQVIRNAIPAADCSGSSVAVPSPCLSHIAVDGAGDVVLTVLTAEASLWEIGVRGQSKAEQRCTNAMLAAGLKVSRTQAKEASACLKGASRGTVADMQACLVGDAGGKIGKVVAKTSVSEAKLCGEAPPFAYVGGAAASDAGRGATIGTTDDVFGPELSAAVAPATDKAAAKCQAAVLKASLKLLDAKALLFLKCAKDRLAGKPTLAVSGPQVGDCLDVVAADAKGRIGKRVGKLGVVLDRQCRDGNVATTLPGACFSTAAPASCLHVRTNCHLCAMAEATGNLGADCDRLDDGLANGSCP